MGTGSQIRNSNMDLILLCIVGNAIQVAGRLIFYEHVVAIPSYSKGTLRRNKVAVGIVLHSPGGFCFDDIIVFIRSVQGEGELAFCQRSRSSRQYLGAAENNLGIAGIVDVDEIKLAYCAMRNCSQLAVAVITDADLDSVLCGVICNRRCTTSGLCQYKVVDSGFLEVVGLKGKVEVTLGIVFSCFYYNTVFQKRKCKFIGFQITACHSLVAGNLQWLCLLCIIGVGKGYTGIYNRTTNLYFNRLCLQISLSIISNLDFDFIDSTIIGDTAQSTLDLLHSVSKGLFQCPSHVCQGVGNRSKGECSVSVIGSGRDPIAVGIQQLKNEFIGMQVAVFTVQLLSARDHCLCIGCGVSVGKGCGLGGRILEDIGSFQPAAHVYYSYNHVIDRIAIGNCSIRSCNLFDLIMVYSDLIE